MHTYWTPTGILDTHEKQIHILGYFRPGPTRDNPWAQDIDGLVDRTEVFPTEHIRTLNWQTK